MASKNIHWTYYTFGFVASLIIGIDCAINAAYYMMLMGGIYAMPIAIIFCGIAGLVLNTILYANDLPEAAQQLEENINYSLQKIFDFKNNTFNDYLNFIQYFIQETIALSSGIVMGLFTYDAYLSMALPLMNPALIIIFCLAYVIGTYALVRTSLNPEYSDDTNIFDKINNLNIYGKLITLVTIGVMILATYWTLITCLAGAIAAATIISPALAYCVPLLFALLLVGEFVFVTKTSIWLGEKIQNFFNETNNNDSNILYNMFVYALVTLNALANGAIAAASSTKIAAVFGSILSFGVMFKSVKEIDGESSSNEAEKEKIYQSLFYASLMIFTGTVIWATWNFLVPFLVASEVANPIFVAFTICAATVCVVLLSFNLIENSGDSSNKGNEPLTISQNFEVGNNSTPFTYDKEPLLVGENNQSNNNEYDKNSNKPIA